MRERHGSRVKRNPLLRGWDNSESRPSTRIQVATRRRRVVKRIRRLRGTGLLSCSPLFAEALRGARTPGVVVDPGDRLQFGAVFQQHPAHHVHLPQLHRPGTLPALVVLGPAPARLGSSVRARERPGHRGRRRDRGRDQIERPALGQPSRFGPRSGQWYGQQPRPGAEAITFTDDELTQLLRMAREPRRVGRPTGRGADCTCARRAVRRRALRAGLRDVLAELTVRTASKRARGRTPTLLTQRPGLAPREAARSWFGQPRRGSGGQRWRV